MKTTKAFGLTLAAATLAALGALMGTAHAEGTCKPPTDASGYFSDGTRNKPFKFVSARKLPSITAPGSHYMEFQVADWQGGEKCHWNPKPRVVSEAYVANFLSEADRSKYIDNKPTEASAEAQPKQ